MGVAGAGWVMDPVENDKKQAANHEDHPHGQEDRRLEREREMGTRRDSG